VETCIDISFVGENNALLKKQNQSFLGFGSCLSFALGIGEEGFRQIHAAK
jgi:hypothetical protein